jgi:hypothetical protein
MYAELGDEADCVDFLALLAGGGPALELGVGTGRIALPLAARGVPVTGIDGSQRMVDRLRAKPGGDRIEVCIGDFADVPVGGKYSLVYVVFNTLSYILGQDEQVRCISNVSQHLTSNGALVVEAVVPGWGHAVSAERITRDCLTLYVPLRDAATQRLTSQFVTIDERGGVRLFHEEKRFVWPSELDLMARIAGLRLRERWAGWRREPFTATSVKHVSVYEPVK